MWRQTILIKDHSDSEKGNPPLPHRLLFPINSMRKETCRHHIGYSFRLTARVLLYAPSHRQDSTYHGLCYTSRGSLAGTTNSSMGSPHEGLIWRPIAPWANALTTKLHLSSLWISSSNPAVHLLLVTDVSHSTFNNNCKQIIRSHKKKPQFVQETSSIFLLPK